MRKPNEKCCKNETPRVSTFHCQKMTLNQQQEKEQLSKWCFAFDDPKPLGRLPIMLQSTDYFSYKKIHNCWASRLWMVDAIVNFCCRKPFEFIVFLGLLLKSTELHQLLITILFLSTRNRKEKHHICCSSILPLKTGSQILGSYFKIMNSWVSNSRELLQKHHICHLILSQD